MADQTPEPVEFRVRFDGTAPGLQQHVLSLAEFGEPLKKMLTALRRLADAAVSDGRRGHESGHVGKFGRMLDLQLTAIKDGCVNLHFQAATVAGESGTIPPHLVERTARTFVEAVQYEWNVEALPRYPAVRAFLDSLPLGVSKQEYEATAGGRTIAKATLDRTAQQVEPAKPSIARTREVAGRITAIVFDAVKGRVTIRDMGGETFRCSADPDVIDVAARLYRGLVVGRVLFADDHRRLLTIRAEGKPPVVPAPSERQEHIFRKWDHTLRKLAE